MGILEQGTNPSFPWETLDELPRTYVIDPDLPGFFGYDENGVLKLSLKALALIRANTTRLTELPLAA